MAAIRRLRAGVEPVAQAATIVLTGAPLAITLAVMLRYAALLRLGAVAMAGALAVAAITSSAQSLLHDLDATMMILIWNLGTAALITALGSAFGARMFGWWPRIT